MPRQLPAISKRCSERDIAGRIVMDANGSDQGGNSLVIPGPTFGGPAWRDLLLHTLKEAKRSDLRISLTIQSGWNVGGPSVTPEQSAKLLTWSRQTVRNPSSATLQLKAPPSKNGFYRDRHSVRTVSRGKDRQQLAV